MASLTTKSNAPAWLATWVKRSRTLHSLAKLARANERVPARQWANISRTVGVLRVLPNTMVPTARLMNAYDCVQFVERDGIEGDVAECGVWEGGCIGLMAYSSERLGGGRRFHLFDSFQGLPAPSPQDADVAGAKTAELVPIGAAVAPRETAESLFYDVLQVDRERVAIHEGWFQDTIPEAARSIDSLAILRLDGDWYESTKVCLEGLYDLVADDGFVIIDDYGCFVGCGQAVDEFFARRGLDLRALMPIDGDGVYFRKPSRR
jgi:O-methyltransferase